MSRFKNFSQLVEELKDLTPNQQSNFLTNILDTEGKLPRKERPDLFTLSIELPISPRSDISEYEKISESAKYASFYAESLFWLISEFSSTSWEGFNEINQDDLFQNLYFVSQIGVALTGKCSDLIDRAELQHEQNDSPKDERISEIKKYATLARLVLDLQIKPEKVLNFAHEQGLEEIDLSRLLNVISDIEIYKKEKKNKMEGK